jgi:AraC-like DNA-binding protein
MRITNVCFNNNIPLQLDCGDFFLLLYQIGIVPGDKPFQIDSHDHVFFELHYIDGGEGINKIDGEDEIKFEFGTIYLAKPGEKHAQISLPAHPLTIYYIGFDILSKGTSDQQFNTKTNELRERLLSLPPVNSRAFYLKPVFLSIFNEFANSMYGSEMMIKGYMLQLLTSLIRTCSSYYSVSGLNRQSIHFTAIQDSIQYIFENLENKISIEELAGIARMSQSNYRRIFKSITGKTVFDFITESKMDFARELLLTRCQVKDVAYQLGYESPENFSKVFKKAFGYSPTQIF